MLVTGWTYESFTELYYNITETTFIFQCSLQLFKSLLPPLCKSMYSHPCRSFSPSSKAIGVGHSAVSHCWCNGVLTGFFFKDQVVNNLRVQGEDCKGDATKLSIHNM